MMLQKLNRVLGRVMPLLTPTSVVLGVLLSQFLNGYEWAVLGSLLLLRLQAV